MKLERYSSVDRWLTGVSADGVRSQETEKLYLHFLGRYAGFLGKTPDQIIEERRKQLRSDDELEQRRHEELVQKWRTRLEAEEGLSRNSVATAHRVIKSFYLYNYVDLRLKGPKTWNATRRKTPTPEELTSMVDVAKNPRNKALIVCLAQSGMSEEDFLGVTFDMVKQQLAESVVPLHLEMRRSKVMKDYDTFLGRDAVAHLNAYLEETKLKPGDALFPVGKRNTQYIVKKTSQRAKLQPYVTPHCLRKFFSTYLTLRGCPEQQVNYWMGHVLPYGGAYFVPPLEQQRELYQKYEYAISLAR